VNHSEIVSFLWGVADLIRDTFKRGKYQDVILPLTVLRRLDCVNRTTFEIASGYVRSRLRTGDLVYAIRGSIGEVAIVPSEVEGANLTQEAGALGATMRG
jgi:type I restriction enzyme M protein